MKISPTRLQKKRHFYFIGAAVVSTTILSTTTVSTTTTESSVVEASLLSLGAQAANAKITAQNNNTFFIFQK